MDRAPRGGGEGGRPAPGVVGRCGSARARWCCRHHPPSTVRPARGPGEGRRPRRPQSVEAAPPAGGWRPALAVAGMVCLAGIQAGAFRAGGCLARLVEADHRCCHRQAPRPRWGRLGLGRVRCSRHGAHSFVSAPEGGWTPTGALAGSGRAGDSFQVGTLPGRTALGPLVRRHPSSAPSSASPARSTGGPTPPTRGERGSRTGRRRRLR
jgi:hypothetical protein